MAYYDKLGGRCKKWKARVVWEGETYWLGYFDTEEEAERYECRFIEELLYA